MKKVIGILAATLGLLFATTLPAHAATDYIIVCNHQNSVDSIRAYVAVSGFSTTIRPGYCNGVPDRYNQYYNQARVDVDIGGSGGDVDSWHKKNGEANDTTKPWGPCYNNEDGSSDPYSARNNDVTTYATFSGLDCHN